MNWAPEAQALNEPGFLCWCEEMRTTPPLPPHSPECDGSVSRYLPQQLLGAVVLVYGQVITLLAIVLREQYQRD